MLLLLDPREETQNGKRCKDKNTNNSFPSFKSNKPIFVWCSAGFLHHWAYSPYLSVGGWSLSDDGAGLRRGQGLLDHDAGIMVAHLRVGLLVLALACLAVQWVALQRAEYDRLGICHILPRTLVLQQRWSITTVWMGNEKLCKLSSTGSFWVQETLSLIKTSFPDCFLPHLFVLPLLHVTTYTVHKEISKTIRNNISSS